MEATGLLEPTGEPGVSTLHAGGGFACDISSLNRKRIRMRSEAQGEQGWVSLRNRGAASVLRMDP